MKILEGNNYCRCAGCYSFLQYSAEDIIEKEPTMKIFANTYKFVNCPVCKSEVLI